MKKLRVLEFFSGIGATHVAFDMLKEQLDIDFEFVDAIEIDPVPMSMYNAMFGTNHSTQDVTKWDKSVEELGGDIDIIQHSSPCFVAGTLVLTSRGYIPIEDVQVGDLVLTHKNRWKKVLRTGSKESETYILKGNVSIETTANHPFYSADISRSRKLSKDGLAHKNLVNVGQWTRADEMKRKQWATINSLPVEDVLTFNGEELNEDFCYFIGRWLGDGWCSSSNSAVYLCGSYSEKDDIYDTFNSITTRLSVENGKTCVKVYSHWRDLHDWLIQNFGLGASNKFLPNWVFSLDENLRESILLGYLDSDGCVRNGNYSFNTISKKLAYGFRLLAESLGYTTSIYYQDRGDQCVIQGRIVNQKPFYNLVIRSQTKCTKIKDDYISWYLCKDGYSTGDVKTVYNLEVEDDNSYIADSIIVHNCQDFSNQGHGAGAEKNSGTRSSLLWEMVRICGKIKPKVMIWENVGGLLNHKHQEVFEGYKEELRQLGYLSYVIEMNASDYGIPQSRPRVFTVSIHKDFYNEYFYTPDPFYNNICLRDLLEDTPSDFKFTWYEMNGKQFLKNKDDNYFKNVKLENQLYYKGINSNYTIYPSIYVLAEIDQAFKSTSRIFSPDGISPTLDTKSEVKVGLKEDLYSSEAIRYITPLEAWRIDGFPDSYYLKASQACHAATKLKKAAGNSISTAQMYHLLKEIIVYVFGEEYYNKDRLSDSIYYLPYFEGKGIYKDESNN